MRFAVRRGVLINVAEPDFEADGTDCVTERQAGFSALLKTEWVMPHEG